jgi:hypothetical protein
VSDAIDELKFSPEIEECLREIKAACEAAYTERIAELEKAVRGQRDDTITVSGDYSDELADHRKTAVERDTAIARVAELEAEVADLRAALAVERRARMAAPR